MNTCVARINSKGQVTIPAELRERLGVQLSGQVPFVVTEDGTVELRPVRYTLDDVLGSIEALPDESADLDQEIHEAIEEAMARKHGTSGSPARTRVVPLAGHSLGTTFDHQRSGATIMTDTLGNPVAREDVLRAVFLVWDETFDTTSGVYLDRGTSLLETLATITAEEASRPVGGGCASIAAQAHHVTYYLDAITRADRGEDVTFDWDGSWDVGPVDGAAWADMIAALRAARDETRRFIERHETLDHETIAGAIAFVTHTAYHLGEIRQALCTIKGSRDKRA